MLLFQVTRETVPVASQFATLDGKVLEEAIAGAVRRLCSRFVVYESSDSNTLNPDSNTLNVTYYSHLLWKHYENMITMKLISCDSN